MTSGAYLTSAVNESDPTPHSFMLLAAGAILFVGLHVALSSRPVRARLTAAIGEQGYALGYSLVAVATFVAMVLGYRDAPSTLLWPSPAWTRWLPNVAMPIASVLLVCALTTKSPTLAGKPGAEPFHETIGIVRVTRHPMLWSFLLWSLSHLPANGTARDAIMMAAIGALALIGMLHIDSRRARAFPDIWRPIAASTSIVPFVAIAQGRNKLVFSEIGIARVVGGLVLWAALLHLHKRVIGLSPLPF